MALTGTARRRRHTGALSGAPASMIGLCLTVLVVLTASVAPASATSPTPSPTPPSSVEDLQDAVQQQSRSVEAATTELSATAAAASKALEAYSSAQQRYQLAIADQQVAEQQLADADAALADNRKDLGRWARQAYYAGSGLSANPAVVSLLGGESDDVAHSRRVLVLLGARRERVTTQTRLAVEQHRGAAEAAHAAADRAQELLAAAAAAKIERDAAVETQKAKLADLESRLKGTQDAAAEAKRLAEARRLVSVQTGTSGGGLFGNAVTGAVGDCAGGDVQLYSNGQIPLDALCSLWGAPGHHLRADAAYAFDRLSAAYARTFGRPICVTDSYRSYAEQVAVKAAKPTLAATPGTSNHGWGTATDLCGGIQSFGTVQHQWMLLNAPAFGWYHPSWAEPSGSLPEPWHWEFGG